MSSDDTTKDLSDESKRTTQPTITAVFELVRELKQCVDALSARLDGMESRQARDFAALVARLVELSEEMKSGFMRLADIIDRGKLHAETDYLNLLRRLRDLETKAS